MVGEVLTEVGGVEGGEGSGKRRGADGQTHGGGGVAAARRRALLSGELAGGLLDLELGGGADG